MDFLLCSYWMCHSFWSMLVILCFIRFDKASHWLLEWRMLCEWEILVEKNNSLCVYNRNSWQVSGLPTKNHLTNTIIFSENNLFGMTNVLPDAHQDTVGPPGCQDTADSCSAFCQPGPPDPSPYHCFPSSCCQVHRPGLPHFLVKLWW